MSPAVFVSPRISGGGVMNGVKSVDKDLPFEMSLSYLRRRFLAIAQKQGWADKKGPAVVAVSGGSDSVALLWFFVQFWPYEVIVAHLEHGIRDQSSLDDAVFVRHLGEGWGCRVCIEHSSVPDLLRKGESVEEGARRIRYDFLRRVAQKHNAVIIALGHTANDVAETVLFNICRGTGPSGLVGIPEVRGLFVRPLINWWRDELRELISSRGISWREDITNVDVTYTRNRIRLEILPLLERTVNSATRKHLVALAKDMQEYRTEEEETGQALLLEGRRDFPLAQYAADVSFARSLSKRDLAWFIRAVGRDLRLKALPRHRLTNLIDTIKKSGRWLFQWEKESFVYCGSDFIVWINPKVLYNTLAEDQEILLEGEGCSFRWGRWSVEWEKVRSLPPIKKYPLSSRCVIYSLQEGKKFRITTVSAISATLSKEERKAIPWWLFDFWPVLEGPGGWRWIPQWGASHNVVKEEGPWIIFKLTLLASALEGER